MEEEEEAEFDIEAVRQRIHNEAPAELSAIKADDSNVKLSLSGHWKGSIQGNIGIIYSPLGIRFHSPESPFAFEQEADLLLSLWIYEKWFVEANFRDDFLQNTYRAGFQGKPGDFVQYAGIGNTGLDFPAFPYMDLGGDSVTSFGFYGKFGRSNLQIHSLFRYDTASREEKVFSGNRERTITNMQPDNYVRGISFVLPDRNITSEIRVYIEDENGTLFDNKYNKRWRLASFTEYAAGSTEGLLELNSRSKGMVAVSYSVNTDNRPWNTSMGYYSVPAGFLGVIQNYFNNIDLEKYPQCGNGKGPGTRPGEVQIGSSYALIIYEPGSFSPFERLNFYASIGASDQASVVRLSSDSVRNDYELIPLDDSSSLDDITIYAANMNRRNFYELLPVPESGSRPDRRRSCESMWPLAKNNEYPFIYLPGRSAYTGDTVLRFTSYSGTNGYFIGTDAVAGSIQVWRSGIQDSNFSYNPATGEIVLSSSVGLNELVRISYLKKNESSNLGSIAAGIGAVYRKNESPFSFQAAVGVRWNIIESDSFTDEGTSSTGNVGLSGKLQWDYDNLKAYASGGFAFVKTDTTGLYRIAGMEGHQLILPLPPDDSFHSHNPALSITLKIPINYGNRANLIYRNYYNNNVFGSNLMPITWGGASVVSGVSRPYPAKDPMLGDEQLLVADFVLDNGRWTGFEVPLGQDADFLARAKEIFLPYRLYDFNTTNLLDFKIIIQFGSLSSGDFPFNENPELIYERELDLNGINANGLNLEIFSLTQEDRQKLGNATHLRVIAVNDNSGNTITGRFLLAPPIIHGTSFRPVTVINGEITDSENVIVTETIETVPPTLQNTFAGIIRRLHPGDSAQRVLSVKDLMNNGIPFGADGRVAKMPLSDYNEISFFIKVPEKYVHNGNIKFYAACGFESINRSVLYAEIPLSAFPGNNWVKVTVRYQGGNTGVSINGNKVTNAAFSYNPVKNNNSGNPLTYTAFVIDPVLPVALPVDAFYIDEIILEDPCIVYRMNVGSGAEYIKTGTFLSIKDYPVFNDLKAFTAVESEMQLNENKATGDFTGSFVNRSGLEMFILGADVRGNTAFTVSEGSFLWSADHLIARTIGDFSFKEIFFASPNDFNVQHNINLSFNKNFYAFFDADSLYDLARLRQKWKYGTGYKPENMLIPSFALNIDMSWLSNYRVNENDNYGELWVQSWEPLIPDSGRGANSRYTRNHLAITQRTKPVGAVLSLDGITNFSLVNNLTRLDNSLFLDVPVIFDKLNLNFRAGRRFQRHLSFSGSDVKDDYKKLFGSMGDSVYLWKVFPFYSLFTRNINNNMDDLLKKSKEAGNAQYTGFTDHFSTRIGLPQRHNLFAFLIPARASLELERVLEQKMDTRSDVLSFSVSLNFSAINMFGSMGYKPLFKFYRTDEFNHAIQAGILFNKGNDDIIWRVQSVWSTGLRLNNSGTLNFINNLTLQTDGHWAESLILNWVTPAKRTLLNFFYRGIVKLTSRQNSMPGLSEVFSANYDQFRKESIEISFDKTNEFLKWSIIAGHEAVIQVSGRLEFTGFLKFRFTEEKEREIFTADFVFGTSIMVSF